MKEMARYGLEKTNPIALAGSPRGRRRIERRVGARETPCGVATSGARRAKRSQLRVGRSGGKSFPGSELCKKHRVIALRKRTQLLSQACRLAAGASRGVWEPERRLTASPRAGQSVQNEANSRIPELTATAFQTKV